MPISLRFSLIIFFVITVNCEDILIKLEPNKPTTNIRACEEKYIESCTVAKVKYSALKLRKFTIPGCKDMVKQEVLPPSFERAAMSSRSVAYTNTEGCEATLTFSGGDLFGNIRNNGTNFIIEPCSRFKGCHVWKEKKSLVFKNIDNPIYPEGRHIFPRYLEKKLNYYGVMDDRTISTFTVKLYFTQEFRRSFSNSALKKFFDNAVAVSNKGYIDSGIPVRMKIHCIEQTNMWEYTHDAYRLLPNFRDSRGARKYNLVRGTADVAVLLVSELDRNICGLGYVDSWSYGQTLSVVNKNCVVKYFSMAHEIGHNFGCVHNKEVGPQNDVHYNYAYGNLIGKGPYRTIMAYGSPRYRDRVNIYSGSNVRYRGQITGHRFADCARVIKENRFKMSRVGNEKKKCKNQLFQSWRWNQ